MRTTKAVTEDKIITAIMLPLGLLLLSFPFLGMSTPIGLNGIPLLPFKESVGSTVTSAFKGMVGGEGGRPDIEITFMTT